MPGSGTKRHTAHGYLNLLRRLRDIDHPLAGAVAVPPTVRLLLTEGNYLLLDVDPWPAIARELNEVWFCALNDETRKGRLVARHVAFGKEPALALDWVHEVDEANARLIEASQARADLIVPNVVLDEVQPLKPDDHAGGV